MAAPLHLDVVSRRRHLLETEVDEVRIPGVLGQLGVLYGHTPLLTALDAGLLVYTVKGTEHQLVIRRGIAEVQPDKVTILANEVVLPEEIDVEAQRRALVDFGEKMKTANADELDELKEGLHFAEACLEVAGG